MIKLFLFEIMLFFSYVLFRIIADKFNLKVKNKTFKTHCKDILDLSFYGFINYLFVFFKDNGLYFDKFYVLYFFISLILFGFILEIPGVGDTVPNIKKWNSNKVIAIIFLMTLTYLNGKNIFILNKRNGALILYLILFSMITLITSYKKNRFKTFHPHHWQIFWFLSLFIIPSISKTRLLSSMFVSFFAHGIIAHSAASILGHK